MSGAAVEQVVQRKPNTLMPFARTSIISAVIAVAAIGCASPDSRPPATDGTATVDSATWEPVSGTVHVSILSCEGLETALINASLTREGLRHVYGEADSIFAWTEPNRHVEGAIDSLFTVYHPGFEASFRVPAGGRDLILAASVTDNRYVSDPALGIGADQKDVVARLGEPTRRENSNLVYECGMHVEQPVIFEIRSGRVSAITISYYVD